MNYLDPKEAKKGKLEVYHYALYPLLHYPLIDVAALSVEKGYKPFNWLESQSPMTARVLISAAQRHLDQLKLGIDINKDEIKLDGTPCNTQPLHAAQVAYCMLMYAVKLNQGTLIDDRLFKDGEWIHSSEVKP